MSCKSVFITMFMLFTSGTVWLAGQVPDKSDRPRQPQSVAAVTLGCSEVPVAAEPLPELGYQEAIEKSLGYKIESFSQSKKNNQLIYSELAQVLPNSFMLALHLAFAEHRPLVISPDMIWLLICQGFARHVKLNAEALRNQLVHHSGRQEIKVRTRDDFIKGAATNPWEQVFAKFSAQIQQYTGPEL